MTDAARATVIDRQNAAMLALARIVNEATRKEGEAWLRFVKRLRDVHAR